MIRTFTLVENRTASGQIQYNFSGDLPLDEVARALIVVALNVERPAKKEEVNARMSDGTQSRQPGGKTALPALE